MKAIYLYDKTSREFKVSKLVDDDYIVQDGETFIEPSEGLYDPKKFSEDGTTWIGTDQAVWKVAQDEAYQEYLKEHPEATPQPTAEEKQLSELIKVNSQQAALNAQLIKQVATLTAGATQSTQEAN